MRIALFGVSSGTACGVSDYARRLAAALSMAGAEVQTPESFSGFDPESADLIHIQYPARAYRKSPAPQILSLRHPKPVAVTLHEYSQARWIRRVMIRGFFRADAFIFTSEEERAAAGKDMRLPGRTLVIPIGSNIPPGPAVPVRDPYSVLYFGLIRPDKGLEEFLSLAARMKGSGFRFTVIGAVPSGGTEFLKRMRSAADEAVTWELNLSPERVSELLSSGTYAYLHYPDGASVRRGSLLAALEHGLTVLSNPGRDAETLPLFLPAETPESAERLLRSGIAVKTDSAALKSFLEARSWNRIAERHMNLYQKLVK